MKTILALQIGTLLSLSTTCIAATVEYQHRHLTIVAKEEPLHSVLNALGKEMRIYVTIPTGLNPVVNCDIQQKPVKQAFKTLLGDMSYSLEWETGGERLAGLTIFSGGDRLAVAAISDSLPHKQSAEQVALPPGRNGGGLGPTPLVTHGEPDSSLANHDTPTAEHDARMEEMEARTTEEQETQEARIKEEVERHDAEAAAYLDSQGIHLPQ